MAVRPLSLQTHHLSPVVSRRSNARSIICYGEKRPSSIEKLSSVLGLPKPRSIRDRARRGFLFEQEEAATAADLQFEAPLKIVKYPDPILRERNKRITIFDECLVKLVDEMFKVMHRSDGIGLAAPQIGINAQVMVINTARKRSREGKIVIINPEVHQYSRATSYLDEGCLSCPGIIGPIERPVVVLAKAKNLKGESFPVNFRGVAARVFQHEFDHLQGILFFDRMRDEVFDSCRVGLQSLEEEYEEATHQHSPEKVESRNGKVIDVGFGKYDWKQWRNELVNVGGVYKYRDVLKMLAKGGDNQRHTNEALCPQLEVKHE